MNWLDTDARAQWLSKEELDSVRGRMPILYVEAIPVRVDGAVP